MIRQLSYTMYNVLNSFVKLLYNPRVNIVFTIHFVMDTILNPNIKKLNEVWRSCCRLLLLLLFFNMINGVAN